MKLKKKIFLVFNIMFAVSLFTTAIFLLMLTIKPMGFVAYEKDSNTVSPYLTHKLAPEFWDKFQIGKPFSIQVRQEGVNDILSRDSFVAGGWPLLYNKVKVFAPQVKFSSDNLMIIAKVEMMGVAMYFTVNSAVSINDDGLCFAKINEIKVGNVDMTDAGIGIAKKMLGQYVGDDIDLLNNNEKIVYNIMQGRPFEPVFSIDGKKVRLNSIILSSTQAVLGFEPL